MQPDGFHDLIRRAQAGDEDALRRLLELIRPWLERVAHGRVNMSSSAQSTADLVQAAWLRVWQNLGQFRGGNGDDQAIARFFDWMAQIVRRLGLNMVRDQNTQRRQPPRPVQRLDENSSNGNMGNDKLRANDATPSQFVEADEQAHRVRAALSSLPEDLDRTIVSLRFFDGLSLRRIAAKLGLRPDQVRERYHAAMRELERELGE